MSKSRQLSDAINSVDISESAPADAVTLDASGNLLVGKTAISGSTVGFEARADGLFQSVRDGGLVSRLYRLNSDGDILEFRKDNATVGSIGTILSGQLYIGGTDTGGTIILDGANDRVQPYLDAITDVGKSNARFKDLYLSGGVYLGGTGAANYLDDYEEGTWTPTGVSGGTWTSISNANYVKVGSLVFAKFQANLDSDGPGTATFGGLPFAVADTQGGGMGLGNPNYDFLGAQVQTTETVVIRHGLDTNNRSIRLSVIYYTSS